MKKKIWTKLGIFFVMVGFLMAWSLPSSNAAVKLKVGIIADFTGAAAVMSATAANGIIDYLKYVNEVKGGVKGNPIDIDWLDAKFQTSLAIEAYHRMASQGALVMVAMNSPMVAGAMPFLEKDKMPLVTLANNLPFVYPVNPKIPNAYIYSVGGCAPEEYTSFVQWALDRWKEKRPMRLVLAYPDNSYGKAILDAFPEWVEKNQGVEIVSKEIVDMNPDDATASLIKIKRANPDYVLLRLMANGIATFLKDAVRVEMKAPIVGNYVGKPADVEKLVPSAQLMDQYMIANLFGVLEDKGAWGMELAGKIAQKYQNKSLKEMGDMYWWGIGDGLVIEEAFRLAIEAHGTQNLTSAIVKDKGFDRIRNLDTGGLIGSVTITPIDHRTIIQHRIIGYENAKLKVLRGWTNNTSIVDWSKPPR